MPWGWTARGRLPVTNGGSVGTPQETGKTQSWPAHEASYLKERLEQPRGKWLTNGLNDVEKHVYLQNVAQNHQEEADACLKRDFKLWLDGGHPKYNDPTRVYGNDGGDAQRYHLYDTANGDVGERMNNWVSTPWGTNQLTHLPGVRDFLRDEFKRSKEHEFKMNLLAEHGPQNLEDAWLYFKHWVAERPIDEALCAQYGDPANDPGDQKAFIGQPPAHHMRYSTDKTTTTPRAVAPPPVAAAAGAATAAAAAAAAPFVPPPVAAAAAGLGVAAAAMPPPPPPATAPPPVPMDVSPPPASANPPPGAPPAPAPPAHDPTQPCQIPPCPPNRKRGVQETFMFGFTEESESKREGSSRTGAVKREGDDALLGPKGGIALQESTRARPDPNQAALEAAERRRQERTAARRRRDPSRAPTMVYTGVLGYNTPGANAPLRQGPIYSGGTEQFTQAPGAPRGRAIPRAASGSDEVQPSGDDPQSRGVPRPRIYKGG